MAFPKTSHFGYEDRVADNPPVQGSVIYRDAPLSHNLLEITVRHAITQIEKDGEQDHVLREVGSFEGYRHCRLLL